MRASTLKRFALLIGFIGILLLVFVAVGFVLAQAPKSADAQPRATIKLPDGTVTIAPHLTLRTCMVQITPPKGTDVLAVGHDQIDACPHEFGVDWTIKTVSCYANAGTPTVALKLTAGRDNSITEKVVPCGERTWLSGLVNGTPAVHTFSGLGSDCKEAPCSLEAKIATVKGVSNWVILRITGAL